MGANSEGSGSSRSMRVFWFVEPDCSGFGGRYGMKDVDALSGTGWATLGRYC